jgi:thioredoxin-like negative regulator of GroEL
MATAAADSDIDSEIEDLLEDDEQVNTFREKRMLELKQQLDRYQKMKDSFHGVYTEALTEKEILNITTTIDKVIVHFYHKDFSRCRILDFHLQKLARKYFNTKFVRINVEKAPFLVDKLKIKVLPCMIGFIKGVNCDR